MFSLCNTAAKNGPLTGRDLAMAIHALDFEKKGVGARIKSGHGAHVLLPMV